MKLKHIISHYWPPLIILLVYLLCFAHFWSFKPIDIANNIDGSWQHTLSGLRHTQQTLGENVFFNYGPLFEKAVVYPRLYDGLKEFLYGNLVFLLILAGSLYSLYIADRKFLLKQPLRYYVLGGAAVLFLTINEFDTLFYVTLLFTIIAARQLSKPWQRILCLAAIQLFSLYKFSFSLSFLVLSPLAFVTTLNIKNLLSAAKWWGVSLLQYSAIYTLLTWGNPLNFIKYFYWGFTNAIHYNEFMSLTYSLNKWIVVSFLMLLFAFGLTLLWINLRASKISLRRFKLSQLNVSVLIISALLFVITFFAFKQAVVRSDGHVLAFTPFIYLILCSLAWALGLHKLKNKVKVLLVVTTLVALSVYGHILVLKSLGAFRTSSYVSSRENILYNATVHNRFNYGFYIQQRNETANSLSERQPEVQGVREKINELATNGRPVLVYGNTTMLAELAAEGHNVIQAPFLQNYAAHPPKLFDPAYIDFLKQHPDGLLFIEETEGSVNERLPSYELNSFFQYVRQNYQVAYADPDRRQYLLQRQANSLETCAPIESFAAKEGVETPIPSHPISDNQYIKLKAKNRDLEPIEKIASALIKKPVFNMTIINQPGGVMTWRTTESTLEHGVAVQPLYLNFHDAFDDTHFDLRGIIFSGGFTKDNTLDITLERCEFN